MLESLDKLTSLTFKITLQCYFYPHSRDEGTEVSSETENGLCHPNHYAFITCQLGREEIQTSPRGSRGTCRKFTCPQHLYISCIGGIPPGSKSLQ